MEHLPIERRVRLSPAAGSPRPAVGKRSCQLLIIGLCRTKFANFIGSSARRRWKRRFSKKPSNTPQGQKNNCGCRRRLEGRFPMKTVAEVIGVSRSNLADRLRERPKK